MFHFEYNDPDYVDMMTAAEMYAEEKDEEYSSFEEPWAVYDPE